MADVIEFKTEDGVTLQGDLHVPRQLAGPAIVMCHGFSGVREQISHYAAAFAQAGFVVLCFDHRGFGTSSGVPRQEVDPARQLSDWRDAITFIRSRPEVRASQAIGVWGSSFAGGLAMVLGAIDPRVDCVVAQIPFVSGRRNGRQIFDVATRTRLQAMFEADRTARLGGAEPARVPALTSEPNGDCALPPAVSGRYIARALQQSPTWVNEVTLRSVENMLSFEPAAWVPYVSPTPLMMIVGKTDNLTLPDLQLATYAQAAEPKRLLVHAGGHFDTYVEHFAETSAGAIEWFTEHLSSPANRAWHDNRGERIHADV